MTDESKARILTRIYVTDEGELVITDLWEELEQELEKEEGIEIV